MVQYPFQIYSRLGDTAQKLRTQFLWFTRVLCIVYAALRRLLLVPQMRPPSLSSYLQRMQCPKQISSIYSFHGSSLQVAFFPVLINFRERSSWVYEQTYVLMNRGGRQHPDHVKKWRHSIPRYYGSRLQGERSTVTSFLMI